MHQPNPEPQDGTFRHEPLNFCLTGIHPGAVDILTKSYNPDLRPEMFSRIFDQIFKQSAGDYWCAEIEAGNDLIARTGPFRGCSLAQICALYPYFLPTGKTDQVRMDTIALAVLKPWGNRIAAAGQRFVYDSKKVVQDLLAVSIALVLKAEVESTHPLKSYYRYLIGDLCSQAIDNRSRFDEEPREALLKRLISFIPEAPELKPAIAALYTEWDTAIATISDFKDDVFARQYPGKTPNEVLWEGLDLWVPFANKHVPLGVIPIAKQIHQNVVASILEMVEEPEWTMPFRSFLPGGKYSDKSVQINVSELSTQHDWWSTGCTGFGKEVVGDIFDQLAAAGILEWQFVIEEGRLTEWLQELDGAKMPLSATALLNHLNQFVNDGADSFNLVSYLGGDRSADAAKIELLQDWLRSINECVSKVKRDLRQSVRVVLLGTAYPYADNNPPFNQFEINRPVALFHTLERKSRDSDLESKEVKVFLTKDCLDEEEFRIDASIATAVDQVCRQGQMPRNTLLGLDYRKLRDRIFENEWQELSIETKIFQSTKSREGVILFYYGSRNDNDGDSYSDVPQVSPRHSLPLR